MMISKSVRCIAALSLLCVVSFTGCKGGNSTAAEDAKSGGATKSNDNDGASANGANGAPGAAGGAGGKGGAGAPGAPGGDQDAGRSGRDR